MCACLRRDTKHIFALYIAQIESSVRTSVMTESSERQLAAEANALGVLNRVLSGILFFESPEYHGINCPVCRETQLKNIGHGMQIQRIYDAAWKSIH